MDRNRVNDVTEIESSAGQSPCLLELWDGVSQIMWHHAGMCCLSAASGQLRAKPAVLLLQRHKRAEAARPGCEHLFWAVAPVDPGLLAS